MQVDTMNLLQTLSAAAFEVFRQSPIIFGIDQLCLRQQL
jgi:hypothetical protein